MLATSYYHPHAFLPAVPSPLSPRSANIYGRRLPARAALMASSPSPSPLASADENTPEAPKGGGGGGGGGGGNGPAQTSVASSRVPFAQRPVKAAPAPKPADLRAQRRGAYLRRVRQGREDQRYAARGDDMMRMDFVQRQRAWEAEQAQAAADAAGFFDGDDEEMLGEESVDAELPGLHGSQMQVSSPRSMAGREDDVDDFLRDEDDEIEALLEFLPDRDSRTRGQDSDSLWSDDVDYDELFSQMLSQQEENAMMQEADTRMNDVEEMDMT